MAYCVCLLTSDAMHVFMHNRRECLVSHGIQVYCAMACLVVRVLGPTMHFIPCPRLTVPWDAV